MVGCTKCESESVCIECNKDLGYKLSGSVCTTC